MSSNPCKYMDYGTWNTGVEAIKRQTWLRVAVWPQGPKSRVSGA